MATTTYAVQDHFTNRDTVVEAIYRKILAAAKKLGPVHEEAKKTSIHLVRKTAFAGVATRKTALVLTLKSASDIDSERVTKHERVSANRWHLEIRLEKAAAVDRELVGWIAQAYALSG